MNVIKAFTLEQASRVAHISTRRASYWARKGALVPSIAYDTTSTPHRYLYDFMDVVGLRTLGMLRDNYDLSLQQLRKAYEYLREHSSKPWSELRFWVLGHELFFTDPKSRHVLSTARKGQSAIAIALEPVIRQVQREAQALTRRSKDDIGKTDRKRNIQGNRVVVKGTRVPVESIISLDEDGYTPERIVRSYPSLTLEDVTQVLAHDRQIRSA